jgi:hypothetical protein
MHDFKRNKLSVAVGMALAMSGVVLTGCDSGGDTTNNTAYVRVQDAHVSVVGLVQDTNGKPLDGVTVRLMKQETTTSNGGKYQFDNVPVSSVSSTDANFGVNVNRLNITIDPPSGYLGATVQVNPAATISTETGATSNVLALIDGTIAPAQTAVLPALTAKISGTLRDGVTGEPVKGNIALDLASVGAGAIASEPVNGFAVSYETTKFIATSGSDGTFEVSGLPADSSLNMYVTGYTFSANTPRAGTTGIRLTVTTSAGEVQDVNALGTILVFPVLDNGDQVPPQVISISPIYTTPTPYGAATCNVRSTLLPPNADGSKVPGSVDNPIVIKFNESLRGPVAATDIESRLTAARADGTTNILLAAGYPMLEDSNRTLKIAFDANTLPGAGSAFSVNILRSTLVDNAGNIVTGIETYDPSRPALGSTAAAADRCDTQNTSGNSLDYVSINLTTYIQSVTTAPVASVASGDGNVTEDTNVARLNTEGVSSTLVDVDDTTADIQNLNAGNINVLQAYAGAVSGVYLDAVGPAASNTVARVSFTPTTANDYSVVVVNAQGVTQTTGVAIGVVANQATVDAGAVPVAASATGNIVKVLAGYSGDVDLILTGVRPGWTVNITSRDGFQAPGGMLPIAIVDKIPPTTTLQYVVDQNGNATVANPTIASAAVGFGAAVGAGTVMPNLTINSALLDTDNSGGLNELIGLSNNAAPAGTYDATASQAFAPANRIGISFSEPVTVVGTLPTTVVGLSNPVNLDGIAITGGPANAEDLLMVNVADVVTLANSGGSIINLANVVQDATGNLADDNANARLMVVDNIPPLVTAASYDGTTNLTVTFNEPVQVGANALGNLLIDTIRYPMTAASISADGNNIVTMPLGGTFEHTNVFGARGTAYNAQVYAENQYTNVAANGGGHGILDFSTVRDTSPAGNSWAAEASALMPTARFAMIDTVGTHRIQSAQVLVTSDSSRTITHTSNHVLVGSVRSAGIQGFDVAPAKNPDGVINSADAALIFTVNGVAVTAANVASFTVSPDGMSVEINIQNLNSGDVVGVANANNRLFASQTQLADSTPNAGDLNITIP